MKKSLLLITLLLFSTLLSASFLMPDQAFKPQVVYDDKDTIVAELILGEDIYIYKDKLEFEIVEGSSVVIDSIENSAHSVEHDGDVVYEESLHVKIHLLKTKESSAKETITFLMDYQGCSAKGLCYEPYSKEYTLEIDTSKLSLKKSDVVAEEKKIPSVKDEEKAATSETDEIASIIKGGSLFAVIAAFFGFGLLLALTPCVFPMIPILSSVIVSQGENISTKRAFFLSVVYVLAMSIAYTFAGVLAGLFGANLQAALQSPWVITLFALVFVGLSMSMFGYYELQMPNAIQSKLSSATEKKGGVLGVAIMGFLSALIVGPCVAAPLAGALIYIGQTGDAVLGGIALFALSIGMGMPLILVGTSAGKFMPKPGAWMDATKAVFGVLMLGVAIWMLDRIIPANVTLMLWSLLFIVSAIHLGALEAAGHLHAGAANRKAFGILLFLYGIALFFGSVSGATNPFSPLEKFTTSANAVNVASASEVKQFKVVTTQEEFDTLLSNSKGEKVLIDFSADWCTACKEMEHNTFANAEVQAKMDEFVLIQVDVTDNSGDQKALMKRFNLFGPPGIVFFDRAGEHIKSKDVVGYKEPQDFLNHLNTIGE